MVRVRCILDNTFCLAQVVFIVNVLNDGQLSADDPLGSLRHPLECFTMQMPDHTEIQLVSMLSMVQQ